MAVVLLVCSAVACDASDASAPPLPGFQRSPYFGEQVREVRTPEGIRCVLNLPASPDPAKATLAIFYATPNGNTIEQTLGCTMAPGLDWHLDIQHIAAQTRLLRSLDRERNIALACVEADGRSWPSWRGKHADNAKLIRAFVESVVDGLPGRDKSAAIAGHSGGGSFIFGFLNAYDKLPDYVTRIAFLDANYAFSDAERHGEKLLTWLSGDAARRLVVLAYDDREITLNGKKVLSTGGTFRATERMLAFFEKHGAVSRADEGPVRHYTAAKGQAQLFVHRNPENKILHTVLVGEMNGLLHAMTLGTALEGRWGKFGTPRAYTRFVQPAPEPPETRIPPRSADAPGGRTVMNRVAPLPREEREAAMLAELLRGNMPDFLRRFRTVRFEAACSDGKTHTAEVQVMPDYLAVGSEADFVRACINPHTAQAAADAFGCSLITARMSDAIYRQAELKLEPRPLTENREAVETFVQHSAVIDSQFAGKPAGTFVAGIKKDVVITNLLQERANRVAIYGWHKPDGTPIQPLTTVHVDWYVDYSHGVRLAKRAVKVDGRTADLWDVLKDPVLSALFSGEGPIRIPHY